MNLHFDFTTTDKRIKPMNAIGQPPLLGISDCYFHYLTEAHIPFSRLHDVGYWYGGYMFVDIPNLFRDFDADENDPASYDFAFTDILMKGLMDATCMPYFRLGVTIENFADIRAYRLDPPTDFGKWARICEHVVRHYNEGWADGFRYGVEYWEIWNEADDCLYKADRTPTDPLNHMWHGSMQQYFELYEIASKHLKACFGDTIKVGGYAATNIPIVSDDYLPDPSRDERFYAENDRSLYRIDWFIKFLDYVSKTKSPLDFFSWHSYGDVQTTIQHADHIDRQLNRFGFLNTESHLNEWNNNPDKMNRASSLSASNAAAMMIAMQTRRADVLCYYDGRLSVDIYGGLFNPLTREPFAAYYSLKGFGELLTLGYQAGDAVVDENGIYALAAHDGNGKRGVLLTNNSEESVVISTDLTGMKVQLIDEMHMMTDTDYDSRSFTLGARQTVYLAD